MSKINSFNRSGSAPRLITYSQSNKERKYWEYQKPTNEIFSFELNGKGKKHINIPKSGEIQNFRKKHMFPQPNTKRTINPNYAPEDKFLQKSKSSLNINEYKKKDLNNFNKSNFQNNKIFPSKKRCINFKYYRNNFSINDSDISINYNNDFYEDPYSKKRQLKNGLFTYYKTTTQIINLPGGIKRNLKEINDDKSMMEIQPKNKLIHPSFNLKVQEDFKSNVSCLPNSMTKYYEPPKKVIPSNPRRFINNDIFLRNNNNFNYFNNSYSTGKKFNKIKRNNSECKISKDMFTQNLHNGTKIHYRNYSQFSLG